MKQSPEHAGDRAIDWGIPIVFTIIVGCLITLDIIFVRYTIKTVDGSFNPAAQYSSATAVQEAWLHRSRRMVAYIAILVTELTTIFGCVVTTLVIKQRKRKSGNDYH